jgi:pimeloyl-ACP methyl ester carboxylesterase
VSTPGDTLRLQDGGSLHYETAGDGEPVVFLHGFGLDSSMWDPQWAAAALRYRVLRYDLRGYGRSSAPTGPYSHTDDLAALLDMLGVSSAHLVGLSMGGRIALRVAEHKPALVRSLTLVDTALDGHEWSEDWLNRWRRMTQASKQGDEAGARALWWQHPLFDPVRERAGAAALMQKMILRYSGWHWRNQDPDLGYSASAPRMSAISVPTLIVVGERDLPDFQMIARRVAAELPQATLREMTQAGHMANMELPREFNELLLEHLQRRRAPPGPAQLLS